MDAVQRVRARAAEPLEAPLGARKAPALEGRVERLEDCLAENCGLLCGHGFKANCTNYAAPAEPGGSKRGGGEGIAVLRPARRHAALEPAHALLGGAVREGLGDDAPLRLLLEAVVSDRARRGERLVDVARVELVHGARVVAPHA